ncbi:MAG TPA: metallophosphoesterase [Solirubrobacteraceae bacterium]|jgi:hypothetical protein|nr:metallophosphoesterase [Solirubrobacteraceae bacterium]
MPDLRFVRVQDRDLSLWQSSVAEHVRALPGVAAETEVLAHPLMQAVSDHVEAAAAGRDAELRPLAADGRQTAAYLSRVAFEKGVALVEGDEERAAALEVEFRKYSDADLLGFLSCFTTYAEYCKQHGGVVKYNDWMVEGGGDLEYGVIDWRLPNDGVVGVIGDWGTGLDDAEALLEDLMLTFAPAALIHLGDIYYSATPEECQIHYAGVIAKVFDRVLGAGKRIPVFTLAGNHDYYALGYSFYETFNAINDAIPSARQPASYFCLRTADDGWQFVAMDTGFFDSNPLDQADPWYAGPWLHPTEVQWHQHKLNVFPGATVLLSHHQLFSAHAKINGMWSHYSDLPYLNPFLHTAFEGYFDSDVAAWLWGHEHNFVAFRGGLFGLAKGRLVGCSAYEELESAEPYKVNYPNVPYLDPTKYRLGTAAGYYNHGYAVIDLARRAHPADPVSISYYQFPSWGAMTPPSPQRQLIFTEALERPGVMAAQGATLSAPQRAQAGPPRRWRIPSSPASRTVAPR